MRVKITGIHMNFTIGVVILLGQRMEKFFNLAFTLAFAVCLLLLRGEIL